MKKIAAKMANISNNALLTFLYFIQGLPYGLQSQFLPIYLHSKGHTSASKISFLKFLYMPWLFKFVWGPLVDRVSSKRRWLYVTSLLLGFICLVGSFVPPGNLSLLVCVLFFLNLLTSIQDVAVDATSISLLNAEEIAAGNIAQVVGYKLGSIFSGGVLFSFVDVIGWTALFCIVGIFYLEAAMFVFVSPALYAHERREISNETHAVQCHDNHHQSLPIEATNQNVESEMKNIRSEISKIFSEPSMLWILFFLFLYKLGEQGALSTLPLYLLDKGISSDDVILWMNLIGQVLSIFGSVLGGLIVKFSSRAVSTEFLLRQVCLLRLFPIGCQLLIMISWDNKLLFQQHLLYASVAMSQLMLLLSGITTTTTFSLMMQLSKKVPTQVQATHYATMSTVEVLGKLLFVSFSGWIVDATGYNVAFLIFAFLNILVLPVFNKIIPGHAVSNLDDDDGVGSEKKSH